MSVITFDTKPYFDLLEKMRKIADKHEFSPTSEMDLDNKAIGKALQTSAINDIPITEQMILDEYDSLVRAYVSKNGRSEEYIIEDILDAIVQILDDGEYVEDYTVDTDLPIFDAGKTDGGCFCHNSAEELEETISEVVDELVQDKIDEMFNNILFYLRDWNRHNKKSWIEDNCGGNRMAIFPTNIIREAIENRNNAPSYEDWTKMEISEEFYDKKYDEWQAKNKKK